MKTFKELAHAWLEDKRKYVKPSTIGTYALQMNKHILPAETTSLSRRTTCRRSFWISCIAG